MSTINERLKASIPFMIICLLIVWLGHLLIQTSLSVEKNIQTIEEKRALSSRITSLQRTWEELVITYGTIPSQKLVSGLEETLLKMSALIEEPQMSQVLSGADASTLKRWMDHMSNAKELNDLDVFQEDQNLFNEVVHELISDIKEMGIMIREAERMAHEDLLGYHPPSIYFAFFLTITIVLLVLLLETVFAGQIRIKLLTLRDNLLHLNQNRLDLNTKIQLPIGSWVGMSYPLPKIAHLINCFLDRHQDVIRKIQNSAENCENATSLIRNCHKEIYEGTRVQANSSDETSSSTFQMNATLNEIGTNVQSLTHSAKESSQSIQQMKSSTHQILDASEELFSLVENSSSSINEMVVSIGQIRQNLNSLSDSAEKTLSSVSEINASTHEVELMAKESAELSKKNTTLTSKQGVKAVEKTIEGMHRIRQSVEDTERMVKILNQRSEEIGEILIVIDEVAEQTNLLALNASIIAARAGEHGKGFAVVADEIKALAEKTTSSIGQIEKAISSVQEETETVSRSINQSVKQVQEGVTLSEDTKRALEKILSQSEKASEMSWKIEHAAIEQVQSIEYVNSETENINQMLKQIANAVEEQDKGGIIIREMVEKLRSFAQQLKKSMSEESKANTHITTEIENFFNKIQEINRAIQEHRKGSDQVTRSIEKIRVITEENINLTDDLNTAIGSFAIHNEELQKEIQNFNFNNEVETLHLGVVPIESEVKMQIKFAPLARYLEQKLKKRVKIQVSKNFESAVQDLGSGKTDFAYLTPSTYIEAKNHYGSQIILKAIRNHSPFYRSVIAVKEGSPIHKIDDLRGKSFGFGDKKSTSSYHVPKAMLAKENIYLADLRNYSFYSHHDAVAWAIVNGDVMAGGLLEPVANKFISKGLKILESSEQIPEFNFCVHPDMDRTLKEEITQALLLLNEDQPEDRNILKSIEYDYNGFIPATESDYHGIEEIIRLSEKEVA